MRKNKEVMIGRDGEGAFRGAGNVLYLGYTSMLTLLTMFIELNTLVLYTFYVYVIFQYIKYLKIFIRLRLILCFSPLIISQ